MSFEKNARQAILRGAMQVVASRLFGQRMQEVAGDREMHNGIRGLKKHDNRGVSASAQNFPSNNPQWLPLDLGARNSAMAIDS
jgi:hypothetical protein